MSTVVDEAEIVWISEVSKLTSNLVVIDVETYLVKRRTAVTYWGEMVKLNLIIRSNKKFHVCRVHLTISFACTRASFRKLICIQNPQKRSRWRYCSFSFRGVSTETTARVQPLDASSVVLCSKSRIGLNTQVSSSALWNACMNTNGSRSHSFFDLNFEMRHGRGFMTFDDIFCYICGMYVQEVYFGLIIFLSNEC